MIARYPAVDAAIIGDEYVIDSSMVMLDVPTCHLMDLEIFRDRLIELKDLAAQLGLDATAQRLEGIDDRIDSLIDRARVQEVLDNNAPYDWGDRYYMCDRERFENPLTFRVARATVKNNDTQKWVNAGVAAGVSDEELLFSE